MAEGGRAVLGRDGRQTDEASAEEVIAEAVGVQRLGREAGEETGVDGHEAARLASELLLSRPPDLADEIESRLLLPKALV